MSQQRNSYFDMLRGIAIIFVVFIHCFGSCYSFHFFSIPAIICRNVFNVAVPIFLAISGYFVSASINEKSDFKSFLKKQIPRVYIPMFFCSLPLFALNVNQGHSILTSLIKLFSCSYSVYYFIALIVQCYLLLTVIKSNLKSISIVFAFSGLMWWAAYTYVIKLNMGLQLPLVVYAGSILAWGFFFCIGVYVRKNGFLNIKFRYILLPLLTLLAVCWIESNYIMNQTQSLDGCGQKVSAFLFNVVLLLCLFNKNLIAYMEKLSNNLVFKAFAMLGRYSFGVYLIHLFILGKVIALINWIQVPSLKWLWGAIITLIISFVVLFLCKKIAPKYTHLLLGV